MGSNFADDANRTLIADSLVYTRFCELNLDTLKRYRLNLLFYPSHLDFILHLFKFLIAGGQFALFF